MAALATLRPEHASPHADDLVAALEAAEGLIIATIERECEALRSGRLLAARALRDRLEDAARMYLAAAKAVRASLVILDIIEPGLPALLDERRKVFSALLRIELSALASERAAARPEPLPMPLPRPAPTSSPARPGRPGRPRRTARASATRPSKPGSMQR